MLKKFVCITVLYLTIVLADNKEGSSCTIEKDGSTGICLYLQDCESAVDDLDFANFPQICSFNKTRLIICCKPVPDSSLSRNLKLGESSPERKVGDISDAKCKEYAGYAYETKIADTLSIKQSKRKTLECPFEKEQLISGGKQAAVREFPHMALIGYDSPEHEEKIIWACGGSLISEDFVLTAAHCVVYRAYGEAKHVRLGLTNRTDTAHMEQRQIEETFEYPRFSEKYHDIGLLKLVEKVTLSIYIRPACLYTLSDTPKQKVIASGWGLTSDPSQGGELSQDLRKVTLDIYDVTECNKTYKSVTKNADSVLSQGILDEIMVCAGSRTDEKKDACQGDSGGPLQVYHEETEDVKCMYDIIGITSFGRGCGLSIDNPGVYTRVSYYIKWIEKIVWR